MRKLSVVLGLFIALAMLLSACARRRATTSRPPTHAARGTLPSGADLAERHQ